MPKLSDLLAEKATASIDIGGAKLAFTFYAMWRERFTEEERAGHVGLTNHEYMRVWLPQMLLSWDLVDEEGHAVPVTAESIEQHAIPDTLLLAIYGRVFNSDLSGKVPTSSNSPGT